MGPVNTLATRQYLALLRQVVQEEGGNISAAARRLGVSQPTASLMLSGQRSVGREAIQRAVDNVGVDPAWFFDAAAEGRDYHDYLGSPDEDPPALAAFLASPVGTGVTRSELLTLRRFAGIVGTSFSEGQWYAILVTLRSSG